MSKLLQGKRVLLTGAGSGIGKATAIALADAGAKVVLVGRGLAKLEAVAAHNPKLLFPIACDAGQAEDVTNCVAQAVKLLGGDVEILINNAGINIKERSAKELTPKSWRETMSCNLDSAFYFIHAVLAGMQKAKDGHIINVSSIAGKRATTLSGTAYAASKFGMAALSTSVALEEFENGIRTCSIFPGEVDTPILSQRPQPISEARRQVILNPEDVASAIVYVAGLRKGVSIPELIITPSAHPFA